ncbi:MAG: CpsD/CapB family tyrosine-protein kinase [Anaerolineae bacterium]|nr:CpsD/CapB family tyrosine-protein kinase [Phycisphaerae bacterium]
MLNQTLVDTGTRYAGDQSTRRVRPLVPPVIRRTGKTGAALKTTGQILMAAARVALDVYTVGSTVCDGPFTRLRRKFFPQIRGASDVRAAVGYTRILGSVPRMPQRRTQIGKAMASHLDPHGSTASAHRVVARSILRSPGEHRTILITSPGTGDGKSVCATNLALVLARSGRSVLLVDGNLRHPTLHTNLDLQNVTGLIDAMRSAAALRWGIQPSGINKLDFLPAGVVYEDAPKVTRLLAMAETKALLIDLTLRYDHIVIDASAMNAGDDASLLARSCDATVLVVRAKHTTHDDATRAMKRLADAGANVAGVVINATKNRRDAGEGTSQTMVNWQPTPPPQPPVLSVKPKGEPAREHEQLQRV